jgi:hypothetical protein
VARALDLIDMKVRRWALAAAMAQNNAVNSSEMRAARRAPRARARRAPPRTAWHHRTLHRRAQHRRTATRKNCRALAAARAQHGALPADPGRVGPTHAPGVGTVRLVPQCASRALRARARTAQALGTLVLLRDIGLADSDQAHGRACAVAPVRRAGAPPARPRGGARRGLGAHCSGASPCRCAAAPAAPSSLPDARCTVVVALAAVHPPVDVRARAARCAMPPSYVTRATSCVHSARTTPARDTPARATPARATPTAMRARRPPTAARGAPTGDHPTAAQCQVAAGWPRAV